MHALIFGFVLFILFMVSNEHMHVHACVLTQTKTIDYLDPIDFNVLLLIITEKTPMHGILTTYRKLTRKHLRGGTPRPLC
jgi:hypothetical protein